MFVRIKVSSIASYKILLSNSQINSSIFKCPTWDILASAAGTLPQSQWLEYKCVIQHTCVRDRSHSYNNLLDGHETVLELQGLQQIQSASGLLPFY